MKIINKDSLRIAYFAGSMKIGHDGVTRVLYKLISWLNDNNIDNVFFSAITPSKEEQPTNMHTVPSISFPLYKDYKLAFPGYHHFEKELEEYKPDILHFNSPCFLASAALKFGEKYDVPVVATYHTHFPSYAKYYNVKPLESIGWNYLKKLYNRCSKVYVPSLPILEELRLNGFNTVEYLPHGVDLNAFSPKFYSPEWKKNLGIENKYALLFAGRLVWEKDLKTLAEAYKIISSKRDDAVFVIAGDGPVKNELQQLMPQAIFLGYISGKELSTAYASSDIFVFPSTTETFGNVTLEAMASGIPPICAREGGAFGIIDEDVTGLIAAPRDANDLADKIAMLLDSPEKRKKIAQNCIEFSKEQRWEKIFERLYLSYEGIVDNFNEPRIKGKIAAA
jgi:phosphatidylinositol alpha 1,6-mannosyltransferase